MWLRGQGKSAGFSVVEMMVVVVIIGILAQLGLSRYRVMTAKSKQAEAKLNLKVIEELQEMHFLEHGKYLTDDEPVGVGSNNCEERKLKNKLGFRPKDCEELRYKYSWNDKTKNEATATSTTEDEDKFIYPGCKQKDIWTVTYAKGRITNTKPVIDDCK